MADDLKFTIEIDTTEFEKRMAKVAKAGPQAVRQELFETGTRAFGRSQGVVPVDTGTLKNSGGTEGPYEYASNKFEMVLYYGGPSSAYAIVVHEDLEAHHDDPTSAKYLEGPVIAEIEGIDTRVGIQIAKQLKQEGVT